MTLNAGITAIGGQVTTSQNPVIGIGERLIDDYEQSQRDKDDISSRIHVMLPAIVVSFNPANQTIVAQPVIPEKVLNPLLGSFSWQNMPILVDIPFKFPGGSGAIATNLCITIPVNPGDEVELVFSDLHIDAWFQSGGIGLPWILRDRHGLCSPFAQHGGRSLPNVIPNFDNTQVCIRSMDGTTKVGVKYGEITATPDNGVTKVDIKPGDIKATPDLGVSYAELKPGDIKMTPDSGVTSLEMVPGVTTIASALINLIGVINATGAFGINGIDFNTHVHNDVSTPLTGPPL